MKLYLSSYRLGNEVNYLKDWLKENDNKILIIHNARDAKKQDEIEKNKLQMHKKLLEDIGFKAELLDLKKYFDDNEKLESVIKKYNAVCVIGGNVFVLRQAMKLSGFDKILLEKCNDNNFLYIGESAGCCVLAKNLKGIHLVDEPINIYNNDDIIYDGISLTDYLIVPHYKSENKESQLMDNVVKYLDENNMKYKTLKDGEVIRINWD